jgi:hypothetical protein
MVPSHAAQAAECPLIEHQTLDTATYNLNQVDKDVQPSDAGLPEVARTFCFIFSLRKARLILPAISPL